MPLTLTRGKTFGATEEVTNSKLHQLVDSATGADVDQTNMGSGVGVALRQTSAPSDTDALWVDTNQAIPVLRHYDGSEWVPSGPFALLTNKSGGTRAAGDVVVADTANAGAYTTTASANNTRVIGVVMASTANNADGLVALPGARVTNVAVTATTAVGDYLTTSTTAGSAVPSSTAGAGVFALALASRSGAGAIAEALIIRFDAQATISAASQAEQETGSSTSVYVSPGRQQFHQSAAKAWGFFNGTGTPAYSASYNMDSSITDHGTGNYTLSFTTDFSSANWDIIGTCGETGSGTNTMGVLGLDASTSKAAGTIRIKTLVVHTGGVGDFADCNFAVYGDQ